METIEIALRSYRHHLRTYRPDEIKQMACTDAALTELVTLKSDLATARRDTERMDWLEDGSRCYHVCIDRQPDGKSIINRHPFPGEVRAAIDAAMKPEAGK